MVEHLYNTLTNKIHFFDRWFIADDGSVLLKDSAEHVYDELIDEAPFTIIKEVIEGALKLLEYFRVLNEIGLHLRCDLLVEGKLLNDQVEVIKECLFNVLANIAV